MSQLAFSSNLIVLHPSRRHRSSASLMSSANSQFIRTSRPLAKRLRKRLILRLPTTVIASDEQSDLSAETEPGTANSQTNETNPLFEFQNIRKILTAVSMVGAAETSYLTFNKIFSSPGAICATQGCLDVLSGPFSSFLGIPLTLLGALAYGVFAYLAVWPLSADEEEDEEGTLLTPEEVYGIRDAATRPILLALSTALFIFSCYLMFLLFFVIQSYCPYCLFSAVLSTSLFMLTAFVGRAVPRVGDALRVGIVSTGVSSIAAALLFFVGYPQHVAAQNPGEPQEPPAITMRSTSDTLRIASKLKSKNAKMYGAFWCNHCYDQKQRFGKRAFANIEYIECDKHGMNSQYQLCRDKRIPGYPTWELNGELFPGEIDLPELEQLVDERTK